MAYGQRIFSGDSLRAIAFPLGGIGTGNVSLGGRGQLCDWEIFNHPGKGVILPYTFFALWCKPQGGQPVTRVLERQFLPPYTEHYGPMNVSSGFGLSTRTVSGLPRFREAAFSGAYPIAELTLDDPHVPLQARLEAYTPFIPLDADDSGLPVAIFPWTLTNHSAVPVEASVALSLLNAAGYDGVAPLSNRHSEQFGGNQNTWRAEDGIQGIVMGGGKAAPDDAQFGTLAVTTPWAGETSHLLHWERAGWWDDVQSFWDDFSQDGRLPNDAESDPSPDGQTDVGALALCATVPPGQSVPLPFLLTWHFPNLNNTWNGEESVRGKRVGNYYTQSFADAWDVAAHVVRDRERLEQGTRAFAAAFFDSSLPECVLDAVSSQASIIRTTTGLRTADGRFHAFEGCGDTWGCCPMNCTHVWNYEQSLAFLFPALERTMRLTDFGINTRPDGRMAFRTLLPLSPETLWGGPPAADGQMGTVLKLYREWKLSGDTEFLKSLWPHAKAALEYAWHNWDADRDGVMEGEQHNTYDIEFYGPNTMVGTLYLAALRAAQQMAEAVGDGKAADEYARLYQSGSARYDALLWNGEYYVQKIVPPATPAQGLGEGVQSVQKSGELRYQYGGGCLSDQLLGQWFARVTGLGDLLPPDHLRSAAAAIYRHNFRRDLSAHENRQRTYAVNDEGGLLICSWPNRDPEKYPFPYADEVWTGCEYEVAALLIYEGLVEEGLQIVQAARARYAGYNRNPWDEIECGHHYARAMSSYSLLLALSGFQYDAVAQRLAFAPRLPGDFRAFFAAGTAWGVFAQTRDEASYTASLEPRWGELTLRAFGLPIGQAEQITASVDDQTIDVRLSPERDILFPSPLTLRAGQRLTIHAEGNGGTAF